MPCTPGMPGGPLSPREPYNTYSNIKSQKHIILCVCVCVNSWTGQSCYPLWNKIISLPCLHNKLERMLVQRQSITVLHSSCVLHINPLGVDLTDLLSSPSVQEFLTSPLIQSFLLAPLHLLSLADQGHLHPPAQDVWYFLHIIHGIHLCMQ